MAINISLYDRAVLNRVVRDLNVPTNFLADTFFPEVVASDVEEIYFDVDTYRPRLSPFVSPLAEGKVVASPGFTTGNFRPAYIKDKRVHDPNRAAKRRIGEPFLGTMSLAERQRANIARDLTDQLQMWSRRLEWMASSVLRTGAVTISGDRYPARTVSFGRDSGNTVTLSGGSRWGQAGISPLDNLTTWATTMHSLIGAWPSVVVMEPSVVPTFMADTNVTKLLDRQAYRREPSLNLEPMARSQGAGLAISYGNIGNFDIWSYQQTYLDDSLTPQKFMPTGTVLMAAPAVVEGVRHFGAIKDEEAGLQAMPTFSKSWVEQDPSVRWLLMQSAPLLAPYRPNATFCATVF